MTLTLTPTLTAQTVHLDNSKRVTHILSNSPYDLNLVVDLPPTGPRALKGGLLGVYGDVLSRVAAKAKGEGRVATVTFLSQQMPQVRGRVRVS